MELLLLALILQTDMGTLVERWSAGEPGSREAAFREVLERWADWNERDLAKLSDARAATDAEIAARAQEALRRVESRRKMGKRLVAALPDFDSAVQRAQSDAIMSQLREAAKQWKADKLSADELNTLAALARHSGARFEYDDLQYLIWNGNARPLVELYATCLDHPKESIRASAAGNLRASGYKRFAHDVLRVVRDAQSFGGLNGMETFWEMGATECLPDVVALLKHRDDATRRAAREILLRMRPRQLADEVAKLLRVPDVCVRIEALQVLALIGSSESVAPMLRDEYSEVRAGAAHALAALRARRCASQIAALLRDPDRDVRRAAIWALGQLDAREYATDVAKLLRDDDGRAADVLARIGSREQASLVTPYLKDPSEMVRNRTVCLLGHLGATEVGREIAPLLIDESIYVRARAAEALGKLRAREQMSDLVETLERDKTWSCESAARALIEIGGRDCARHLAGFIKSGNLWAVQTVGLLGVRDYDKEIVALLSVENPDKRGAAAETLLRLDARAYADKVLPLLADPVLEKTDVFVSLWPRERIASVAQLLEHREQRIHNRAAYMLAALDACEHAPAVAKLLRHDDETTQTAALTAMETLGRPNDGATIAPLLQSPHPDIRASAARTLGRIGAKDAADAIARLVDDQARGYAAEALGLLEARVHAPRIARLLNDVNAGVRAQAARALARLGVDAGLQALFDDGDPYVRTAAIEALEHLGRVEALQKFESDGLWRVRTRASIALVRLGRKARAAQIALLDEVQVGDDRNYLVTALVEALAWTHHPEVMRKLTGKTALDRPIDSVADLCAMLSFDPGGETELRRRKTSRVVLLDFIRRALCDHTGLEPVIDAKRVMLMRRDEALGWWRAHVER